MPFPSSLETRTAPLEGGEEEERPCGATGSLGKLHSDLRSAFDLLWSN